MSVYRKPQGCFPRIPHPRCTTGHAASSQSLVPVPLDPSLHGPHMGHPDKSSSSVALHAVRTAAGRRHQVGIRPVHWPSRAKYPRHQVLRPIRVARLSMAGRFCLGLGASELLRGCLPEQPAKWSLPGAYQSCGRAACRLGSCRWEFPLQGQPRDRMHHLIASCGHRTSREVGEGSRGTMMAAEQWRSFRRLVILGAASTWSKSAARWLVCREFGGD